MKLYAFQPPGHGQTSFFVMAEDEARARACVEARAAEMRAGWLSYEVQGWPDDYRLTVCGPGQIVENSND